MNRNTISDAEAIIMWLQTPATDRSPLSPKQMELFQRWNTADDLLREHMSTRKVIPMLQEKFNYSKRSAERDLEGAMKSWAWKSPGDKRYLSEIMFDFLMENMVKASKLQKFGDVARLAKVAIDCSGIGKKEDELPDPNELQRPVAILPMFSPDLVGGVILSDDQRRELVQRVLKEKRDKGLIDGSTTAEFSEVPSDE
jgi:hypothetical protein